jgi:prophage maintenance system killer protein
MTRAENVFWAKRNIVDYIWKSAKLEGLSVTFPETDAIYNGMSVANVRVEEIIAVNNLKHAWQFVLDNLDYVIDYPYICKINQIVGGNSLVIGAGYIRNFPVSIGGTSWKPDMPIESQIKEELADIAAIDSPTERAITLMLYLMRKQMFSDGNKRTAMLAANQVMISFGCGIITIPIEKQPDFVKMLVSFYESGDMNAIRTFVYNEGIDGADMSTIHDQPLPDMSMFNEPDDGMEL